MVLIIDYGLGNLGSMLNMLRRLGVDAAVSARAADVARADRLILPGVGAFDAGMRNLRASGLVDVLTSRVLGDATPILGVCLGMQLFARCSAEGSEPGLGWLDADVVRFEWNGQPARPVPHMGWNTVERVRDSLLLEGVDELRFYFVHSYHLRCRAEDVVGVTRYGYDFPSVISSGNIMGTQFHPEKSHRFGMGLLKAFSEAS